MFWMVFWFCDVDGVGIIWFGFEVVLIVLFCFD